MAPPERAEPTGWWAYFGGFGDDFFGDDGIDDS
jgi:hypothetical protein